MPAQTQLVHDQHTVPQWHLRNFVNVDGMLRCYRQNRRVRKSWPKGTCWEHDFYEYELNGKKTYNKYEIWLGCIENDAAETLQALLNHRPLEQREAAIWATHVAALFVRTEKYRAHISAAMIQKFGQQSQNPDFIRDLQYELLKEGKLVFAADLKKNIEQFRVSMDDSPSYYHLSGLERNVVSLGNAIIRKTWHVIQAPPGKFFLTSDCPVTTVELVDGTVRPGPGFGKEHAAIILPITPEHLFVAASPLIRWQSVGDPRLVDSVNLLTVQFAYKRVYSHVDSPEIKALVDTQINQIVFGKNAFVPASQNPN